MPPMHGLQDCKYGRDGTRIVEATSTTIGIYDVLRLKENPPHFKFWSPWRDIKPNNQEMDEDAISIVLLHPHLNIVFWVTKHGLVGAYDFEKEKFIRRVHLPQSSINVSICFICKLVFSITLDMLVFYCPIELEDHLFTWTLNDEHVERINGFNGHSICDLHNDQVQLLVKNKHNLAIWDLRQRKELYRWHTKKDINLKLIHEEICYAKFSSDCELVYVVFNHHSVGVFDATACLQLRCRITAFAYAPHDQSWRVWDIVAHPQKHNQFALYTTSWGYGRAYVTEPSHELGGEWVCKAK